MTFTSLCFAHSQRDSKRSDSEGDLIPLKILHTKPPIPSCTSLGGEARNFIKLNPCTTKQLLQLFLPKEDQRFIKFSFIIPIVPLFFLVQLKICFCVQAHRIQFRTIKTFIRLHLSQLCAWSCRSGGSLVGRHRTRFPSSMGPLLIYQLSASSNNDDNTLQFPSRETIFLCLPSLWYSFSRQKRNQETEMRARNGWQRTMTSSSFVFMTFKGNVDSWFKISFDHLRANTSPGIGLETHKAQSIWSTPKVNNKTKTGKMCIVRYIFFVNVLTTE